MLRSKWPYVLLVLLVAWAWGFDRLYRDTRDLLSQHGEEWETVVLTRDPPTFQRDEDVRLTRLLLQRNRTAIFRAVNRTHYERYGRGSLHGRLQTQYIRASRNQLPEIHEMVADACSRLRVDPVPRVYVGRNPAEPLTLLDWHEPTLIVDGELLWAYDREELRYLLAREIAHVKCNHVFLLEMMHALRRLLGFALPDAVSSALFGTVGADFATWRREAEMSADIGGLLVTGDVSVARSALLKLVVGADYDLEYGAANPNAFAEQLVSLEVTRATAMGVAVGELNSPDPFLTLRVANLQRVYEANPNVFK